MLANMDMQLTFFISTKCPSKQNDGLLFHNVTMPRETLGLVDVIFESAFLCFDRALRRRRGNIALITNNQRSAVCIPKPSKACQASDAPIA